MTRLTVVLSGLTLAACWAAPPAIVAPIRSAVPVSTSFGKTWTAAVDAFADKNIGIRTIDRSSGLIVADVVQVPPESNGVKPSSLADCGKNAYGQYLQPEGAIYNVRVKGDSSSSSVLVTVQWTSVVRQINGTPTGDIAPCVTRGVWESGLERSIKEKAEGRG